MKEVEIQRATDRSGAAAGRAGGAACGDLRAQPAEICRKMGISETTFYAWRKRYAGMGIAELRRVKQLEDENQRLKRLVADLTLDKQMLQEVLTKKL